MMPAKMAARTTPDSATTATTLLSSPFDLVVLPRAPALRAHKMEDARARITASFGSCLLSRRAP